MNVKKDTVTLIGWALLARPNVHDHPESSKPWH